MIFLKTLLFDPPERLFFSSMSICMVSARDLSLSGAPVSRMLTPLLALQTGALPIQAKV